MGRRFGSAIILTIALVVLWFSLSDLWYKPLILGFGALGVVTALVLSLRMGVLDDESVPFLHMIAFGRYWSWLGGEIVKANIYVVRTMLRADLDIQPALTRVPVAAETDLARATFANSITLTPGTVTVEVEETGFLVHALTEELADHEAFREMERRAIAAAQGKLGS